MIDAILFALELFGLGISFIVIGCALLLAIDSRTNVRGP